MLSGVAGGALGCASVTRIRPSPMLKPLKTVLALNTASWETSCLRRSATPRIRPSTLGQSMVEYVLLVALVGVALMASIKFFGGEVSSVFSRSADSMASSSVFTD